MIIGRGPIRPTFPLSLVHPLGPTFRHLPLALRRHLLYFNTHRRWGNFASPRRFTEKMQWRILNDNRGLIALACDKIRTKQYVSARWSAAGISERFKIPETYWTGGNADDLINYISNLPSRYVIKPNHSSGRFLVVDTQEELVAGALIREIFADWLRADEETDILGHWGYKIADRTMIVEERVGLGSEAPVDIRLFTNRGTVVGAACTGTKPNGQKWSATYDGKLQRRPSGYPGQLPLDAVTPLSELSKQIIDELRLAVRAASEEFDQVRVDMYRAGQNFYFGEFTVYSSSGLVKYNDETDYRLGEAWKLPSLTVVEDSGPR